MTRTIIAAIILLLAGNARGQERKVVGYSYSQEGGYYEPLDSAQCAVRQDNLENHITGSYRFRKALSYILPSLNYGHCERCGLSWNYVKGHETIYLECTDTSAGWGCFPLCEQCWRELTPQQRLPYYRKMYQEWLQNENDNPFDNQERKYKYDTERKWTLIERAVLGGK